MSTHTRPCTFPPGGRWRGRGRADSLRPARVAYDSLLAGGPVASCLSAAPFENDPDDRALFSSREAQQLRKRAGGICKCPTRISICIRRSYMQSAHHSPTPPSSISPAPPSPSSFHSPVSLARSFARFLRRARYPSASPPLRRSVTTRSPSPSMALTWSTHRSSCSWCQARRRRPRASF